MGVHVGQPRTVRDPMTRRVEFIGPVVNAAARITALTHGGQIVLSEAAFTKVKDSELAKEDSKRMICLGKFEMPDAPRGTRTLHAIAWNFCRVKNGGCVRRLLTWSDCFVC
jgi:class 3 adenylate cyclase